MAMIDARMPMEELARTLDATAPGELRKSRLPQGLLIFAWYVLIKMFIGARPPQLAAYVTEDWWRALFANGLTILFMAALIPIYLRREGLGMKDLGYTPRWGARDVAIGLGAGALILSAHDSLLDFARHWTSAGVANTAAQEAYDPLLRCMGPAEMFGFFFSTAVMPPLIEELMYRGCLLSSLAKRWGRSPRLDAAYIIAGGVLFSSMHLLSHPLYGAVYALTGSLLSFLYLRTGSLNAAILAHAVINGYYAVRTLSS